MRDLQELFDAVDLVVGGAVALVGAERAEEAGRELRDLRRRRGYLGSTLVVALVGGTGSGKSSLLNAIAGEPVTSVSALRPHTEEPTAWVPDEADASIDTLLDTLEITRRHRQTRVPGLALLDLPDMDSVEDGHRRIVERLVPKVDALIWVLDPDKYRDPELHADFLEPLSRYADQTVFVLNKVDLLAGDDRTVVLDDVRRALFAAGYPEPLLFSTSADPSAAGDPATSDLGELPAYLAGEMDRKRVAHEKLLADVADVLHRLAVDAEVWTGTSIGLEESWAVTRRRSLEALGLGNATAAEDVTCRLEDFVAACATRLPTAAATEVRARLGHHQLAEAVVSAMAALEEGGNEEATHRLDTSVAVPMRDMLRGRAEFAAAVAYAHVGARQLAARDGATWS